MVLVTDKNLSTDDERGCERDNLSHSKLSVFFSTVLHSIDTFETHEGVLYCKLHFKSLFSPKAVEDAEPGMYMIYAKN